MGDAGAQVLRIQHDVIIVGGGPAGLTAARDLASNGHDAVVLEEHEAVGYPVHCTGVLGLDAFDEIDLPRHAICSVARSATFHAASGRSVLVEAPAISAAVVDRGAFDQGLAAQAVAAGATLRLGTRVRAVESGPSGVRVTLAGGSSLTGRACVLACGANYRFNRVLGLGAPRAFVQSAQIEVPFPSREHVEVHLGRGLAPRGFAWLVPFRREGGCHARLGLMCESRALGRFRAFADLVRRTSGVDRPWPTPRLRLLPLGPVTRTYAARVLAVGDAAGLVKPTTGGGIYYGVLSGRLAADVLDHALSADALGEADLRAYQEAWQARLGPEIRTGLAFRTLASRLNDHAVDALIELARVDGIVPLLRRTANFNWHRDAALALLRNPAFRRILLTCFWG